MQYHVSRNGQNYGPYTLDDLHRYVASGHILPTDQVRAEDAAEWVPVSQFLSGAQTGDPGGAPAGYAAPSGPEAPGYGAPSYGGAYAGGGQPVAAVPAPPNLSWGLLLLFGVLTCGIFTIIYELIQASWLKRINPPSKVLLLYIVAAVFWFLNATFSAGTGAMAAMHHGTAVPNAFRGIASLSYLIVLLVARFTMRSELEQHYNTVEPIGLTLSGVMTFFFGSLYFQYHFNRINELKQTLRMAGGYPPR